MKSSNNLLLSLTRRRGRTISFLITLFAVLCLSLIFIDDCHLSPYHFSLRPTCAGDSGYEEIAEGADYRDSKLGRVPGEFDFPSFEQIHPPHSSGEENRSNTSSQVIRLAKHKWNDDGILEVNTKGPHPIYELVKRAESQWKAKNVRSSKTLRQAVYEYKRRYNRSPPKGFDHWWNYVQEYDIKLPDEYDQIYNDLEPYWGMDPRELQKLQEERELELDSFTIGKDHDDDLITLLNMTIDERNAHRANDFRRFTSDVQLDMLRNISQIIPPFRATLRPHDNPTVFMDWSWKRIALEAAQRKEYVSIKDFKTPSRHGWASACPLDSPLSSRPDGRYESPYQTSKTFIHDHRAAMDPCLHPQLIATHGTFLGLGVGPNPRRFGSPLFSFCASALHNDIRVTSLSQSSAYAEGDVSWDEKTDSRLFWRGSPTGMFHEERVNWRQSQRIRLVKLTASDDVDAASDILLLRSVRSPEEPVGEADKLTRAGLNEALMDISLTGAVINCEGEVCQSMKKEFNWKERMSSGPEGAGRYKYVLDVDGNGWSARFRRLMSSNSLVFKATIFPEWWTDRVQPWVHYVPVQVDYSDLYDSFVFFAGDEDGKGAHEVMAKKIASAGKEWALNYWRPEDITAYMFRLWLEYARVMSLDRDNMNFDIP